MSKGIHYFLNSGANIHSKYSGFATWEDMGTTEAEWDALTEKERDDIARELAFERSEWGYYKDEKQSGGV